MTQEQVNPAKVQHALQVIEAVMQQRGLTRDDIEAILRYAFAFIPDDELWFSIDGFNLDGDWVMLAEYCKQLTEGQFDIITTRIRIGWEEVLDAREKLRKSFSLL